MILLLNSFPSLYYSNVEVKRFSMNPLSCFKFHAKQFSDIHESLIGESLFEALNSKPFLGLLVAGTLYRVDVASTFNVFFGDDFSLREKQYAGFVIRAIMESNGFRLDQQGVKARISGQMAKGSRFTI